MVLASLPVWSSAPTHAAAVAPGHQVDLGTVLSPDPSLDTSGDFATDTFSNPWDFSDPDDLIPIPQVGAGFADAADVSNGLLTVASRNQTEFRLLMNWGQITPVLPWGHDGWLHPIDAGRYTQLSFRIKVDAPLGFAVRWWKADGSWGVIPMNITTTDWQTLHFDLTDRKNYPLPGADAVWGGAVTRFELFRGAALNSPGQNPTVNVQLDWVRLYRNGASMTPPGNVPVPQVLSPNETGGADYATTELGNPWDFAGMDDVNGTNDVTNLSTASGDLTGTSFANDPSIGLHIAPNMNTDKYHHLTIDLCEDGPESLADTKGGGMIGRMAWYTDRNLAWSETQDFVVFPGCHTVTIDMITSPAAALHDEFTTAVSGWKGIHLAYLRFDPNEDRGLRNFSIQNIRLTDDAAFSTNYGITFADAAATTGTTADIYVTNTRGAYTGTKIASGLAVAGGTNTFTWNGTDATGKALPNGTYWTYIVMHNGSGTGVGYSSGPVRIEKPVPPTPSYYVPLTPARLLDTRDGEGGNLSPLPPQGTTQLTVTGVGGVPATGVTAVVMNVTATQSTGDGFITAYPSGEARPLVSNVNFVAGQDVPNLVTVKVGANGRVDLFNSFGYTDVIADVVGYYTPNAPASGGKFTALTPTRLLDTRAGQGAPAVPIGQNQSINLTVTGVGGVPATGVSAVALNVTVDQPTGVGFLTVWPTGEAMPNASTHNFVPGLTIANLVLAKVGANGQVSIYNSAGSTHVVADVIGYFSASGGLFTPVTPQRLIDTRDGTGGSSTVMGTAETHTMAIATSNPIPAGAKAVVVNVTSVNSSAPSYVTVWPTNATQPLASTLNPRPGAAVPNQAYLRIGQGGGLDAFNAHGSTDIIVDVFGYVM